jgi:hypothetical protein
MVSRLIIGIAVLCSSIAFSQEESALKFNQVLLIELDSGELFEVPEGKVWKIVSAVVNPTQYQAHFFVNNNLCKLVGKQGGNGGHGVDIYSPFNIFPMWLPEETNLRLTTEVSALSIIEFNTN